MPYHGCRGQAAAVAAAAAVAVAWTPAPAHAQCVTDCTARPLYECSLHACENLQIVHLAASGVYGTIPSWIGSLSALSRALFLEDNELSGTLPPSVGSLTGCTSLKLERNQLTGSLPASLGHLTAVSSMHLTSNRLGGSLPASLGSCKGLSVVLELSINSFSGQIPPSLGSLPLTDSLLLQDNSFSGTVPSSLGSLSLLRYQLQLDYNQIAGTLPPALGSLSSLRSVLWVDDNLLTGTVPTSLCSVVATVGEFDFSSNAFSCPLPAACAAELVDPGGAECVDGNGTTTAGATTAPSDSAPVVVIVGSVAGVAVAAALVGVLVFCLLHKKNLRKLGHRTEDVSFLPLISAAHAQEAAEEARLLCLGGGAAALVGEMRKALAGDVTEWEATKSLARLVSRFTAVTEGAPAEQREPVAPGDAVVVEEARAKLRAAMALVKVMLDKALADRTYDVANVYMERSKLIAAAFPGTDPGALVDGASAEDSECAARYECVAPGVLLRRDRFAGGSAAFLGRGASAAVSRGLAIDLVGTAAEVRTVVAVKEVQKTGQHSEQRTMREYVLLSKKLQPQHPNIIHIYSVKATPSSFLIVMECCCFALDKQPEPFQDFLHGAPAAATAGASASPAAAAAATPEPGPSVPSSVWASVGDSGGGGGAAEGGATGDSSMPGGRVGATVLNALVQDVVRAVAYLHAKKVFHCDIKPANCLVALDRSGRRRECKPKYFHEAQLKLTDFGVSRVIQPAARPTRASSGGTAGSARSLPSAGSAADAAAAAGGARVDGPVPAAVAAAVAAAADLGGTTTATVSFAALNQSTGIAGSEAYMSPEMLEVIYRLKKGLYPPGAAPPEVTEAMLVGNDTFGTGCVVAYLCSRGLHPFQSAVFNHKVSKNIRAHRRMPLADLEIVDHNHLQLVDVFTHRDPARRWTAQQALRCSPIFGDIDARPSVHADDSARILLDSIDLRRRPAGSCRAQLLAPHVAAQFPAPLLATMLEQIDAAVRTLGGSNRAVRGATAATAAATAAAAGADGSFGDAVVQAGSPDEAEAAAAAAETAAFLQAMAHHSSLKLHLQQQRPGSAGAALDEPRSLPVRGGGGGDDNEEGGGDAAHSAPAAEAVAAFEELDADEQFAVVAYTYDNGQERESNIYFKLNRALRSRREAPEDFAVWEGFLYFLLSALDHLPRHRGTVFRGGNEGIDQAMVGSEYRLGRPIQWAGFSSSSVSLAATKGFVRKSTGVIFRISVVSGTHVGPCSYFPREGEILLSPNTQFVVTRELYRDPEDGYAYVDLAESQGSLLSS